jgi:hypothetical protein
MSYAVQDNACHYRTEWWTCRRCAYRLRQMRRGRRYLSMCRRIHSFCSGWDHRSMKRKRPGMGRIPGPRPNVAVVYPFLKEAPLGRLTELPGDEGYKISMPCGRTEFKRKVGHGKAPIPVVARTSSRQCIEASHGLPVRDHRTGGLECRGNESILQTDLFYGVDKGN